MVTVVRSNRGPEGSWRPLTPRCARTALGVVGATALLLGVADADAAGLSVARFGGEHGNPMTTNGTSLYYNPGAFAASEGTHLLIDGTLAWRSASYQHTADDDDCFRRQPGGAEDGGCDLPQPAEAEAANTAEGTLSNFIVAPTAFVTTKLGDVGLALGFFTPYGGQAKWDKNEDFEDHPTYQGLVDGGQRWYTIDGILRTSYVSLGAGYHLKDMNLSFGVALNALLSTVQTLRARVAGTSNDDITKEGRSVLDVSGLDFAVGLGVRFEPTEGTAVGLSWQSAPNINGKMELDGTLTNIYGPGDVPDGSEGDVTLHQTFPNTFRAGVESKLGDKLALRVFGDYTTWSSLENQCVTEKGDDCDVTDDYRDRSGAGIIVNQPRDWQDTFGLRLGLSYFFSDSFEGYVGAGFASNAVPNETLEPALMDSETITPAIGARFGLTDSIFLATTYTHVFYFDRDNAEASAHFDKPFPSQGPDAGGTYKQQVAVLNVNLDIGF